MKIRTDFVTNSSSSSFCSIRIDAGDNQYELEDAYRWDFMSFEFSDPSAELEHIKSASELLDIILGALGAWKGCLGDENESELSEWLASIDDASQLNSMEIEVYETGEYLPTADVEYYYDFKLGEGSVFREDLEREDADDEEEDEEDEEDEDDSFDNEFPGNPLNEQSKSQNQQGKESGLADDGFVVVYLPNSIKVKVPKDKLKYCLTTSPYGIIRYDYEAVKRYGIIQ